MTAPSRIRAIRRPVPDRLPPSSSRNPSARRTPLARNRLSPKRNRNVVAATARNGETLCQANSLPSEGGRHELQCKPSAPSCDTLHDPRTARHAARRKQAGRFEMGIGRGLSRNGQTLAPVRHLRMLARRACPRRSDASARRTRAGRRPGTGQRHLRLRPSHACASGHRRHGSILRAARRCRILRHRRYRNLRNRDAIHHVAVRIPSGRHPARLRSADFRPKRPSLVHAPPSFRRGLL